VGGRSLFDDVLVEEERGVVGFFPFEFEEGLGAEGGVSGYCYSIFVR